MTQTQPSTLTDEQLAIVAQITVKLATLGHEVTFQHPISIGPLVTTYRFAPKGMSKVGQLCGLAEDLAIALSVEDVLIRRIPGEAVVGVTVPNKNPTIVQWRDTIQSVLLANTYDIPINFGVDSLGKPYLEDLVKLPHLLVAGSTGSGKSTFVSSVIASLMYARAPHEVQFILSDTKQVEFGHFLGSQHLLFDPLTSIYQTMEKMDWLVDEMERRLKLIATTQSRNIHEYNALMRARQMATLCFIVLVIDELADILSGDKRGEAKVAEAKLQRIVQKSRAAGVYVIASTQRPSVNVVSGSIKANFPARLSFKLPSGVDSRTVLGTEGAEHLLTRGDMLYQSPLRPALVRLHSAYATADDIRYSAQAALMRHGFLKQ